MPWQTATKIELSEKQQKILEEYANGSHTPLHLKVRAKIIIMAEKGYSNNSIEENLEIAEKKVKLWRDRYSKEAVELNRIEKETPHKLRSRIIETLSDKKRAGAPPKFTDEQVAAIIAISCEDPAKFELPFSHWTPELLRIEVIKLGIVESISTRQIGRFLKRKRFETTSKSVLVKP